MSPFRYQGEMLRNSMQANLVVFRVDVREVPTVSLLLADIVMVFPPQPPNSLILVSWPCLEGHFPIIPAIQTHLSLHFHLAVGLKVIWEMSA